MTYHELTLGGLTLTGDPSFPDDTHGFWFEVCAEGTEFGEPAAVTEIVQSLLADGDLVQYRRDGNRTVPIRVRVHGSDLGAVAHGEAALRRETKQRNELTWQPPDYFAPASVFESYPSSMSRVSDSGWDLDEKLRIVRTFAVELTCSPHARSLEPMTVSALPAPGVPSTITVDNADSTTGWTATAQGPGPATLVDAGSYLTASVAASSFRFPGVMVERLFASVAIASTPYLRVELSGPAAGVQTFWVRMDGVWVQLTPVLAHTNTSGTTYYYLSMAESGTDASGVRVARSNNFQSSVSINVHDVSRTNALSATSPRQLSRIIEVGGTERTPGSLRAFTPSGYLGHTLLHTTPWVAGYTPDMRRWRVSGNALFAHADARKITGTWEPLQPDPVIARAPSGLLPRGDYILVAALKVDTPGTYRVNWAVKSMVGATIMGADSGSSPPLTFTVANQMQIMPIAVLSAPIVRSLDALDVEVHLQNSQHPSVFISVEEWWMFTDGEESALTIAGISEASLWVNSPDADNSEPTVWTGSNPTISGAYHPAGLLIAQGTHTFSPGPMLVTSVSDSNDYMEVSLTYYERWHSNAAR